MVAAVTTQAEAFGVTVAASPPKALATDAESFGIIVASAPPHAGSISAEAMGLVVAAAWHVPVPVPFVVKLPCANWCLPLWYLVENDQWTL